MAEAWDALRGDTSGWEDRDWFCEVIARRGEPVLDVGTGTGRLLLDFLAQGIDIEGVDNAPDMLERLHAKAAAAGLDVDGRVHLGRMQTLRLTRRFGTIMVPSSSFQLLSSPTTRPRPCAASSPAAPRRFARDAVHRHGQALRGDVDEGRRPRGRDARQADAPGDLRSRHRDRGHRRHVRGVQRTASCCEPSASSGRAPPARTRGTRRDRRSRRPDSSTSNGARTSRSRTARPTEVFTIIGRRPE